MTRKAALPRRNASPPTSRAREAAAYWDAAPSAQRAQSPANPDMTDPYPYNFFRQPSPALLADVFPNEDVHADRPAAPQFQTPHPEKQPAEAAAAAAAAVAAAAATAAAAAVPAPPAVSLENLLIPGAGHAVQPGRPGSRATAAAFPPPRPSPPEQDEPQSPAPDHESDGEIIPPPPGVDATKWRRTVKNRQSAKRSTLRKKQYVAELEAQLQRLTRENESLREQVHQIQQILRRVADNCISVLPPPNQPGPSSPT